MNKKEKLITVWIVDDDEINRSRHKLSFRKNCPDIRVTVFDCLYDAFQRDSNPDFIFIDLSTIDRPIPCFDHSYITALQGFVEKHDSAFIIIIGALIPYTEEDVEDLRKACPNIKLFALDSGGRNNYDALVKFVNKFSPL